MVNQIELRRALDLVVEADENGLHDQQVWLGKGVCGTAGCLAGLYLLDKGYSPVWDDADANGVEASFVVSPNGDEEHVHDLAMDLLGLNGQQADALFDIDNQLGDLIEMVDRLCAGLPIQSAFMDVDEREPALV